MTLIDKAEALAPCPFCGGRASLVSPAMGRPYVCCDDNYCTGPKPSAEQAIAAWNRRAAIPARGVGVKPLGADGVKIHPQDILNAAWRDDLGEEGLAMYDRILAALAPTDAAHVNETPKSEHDADNVLTPAPDAAAIREAGQ